MTTASAAIPHSALLETLRIYLRRHYDLDEHAWAFKGRRFYSLEVELNNLCNRERLYCYNLSSPDCMTPDLPLDVSRLAPFCCR